MNILSASVRCDAPDLSVELSVPPGSTLAVLGPNGAGKSTLLSVLAGVRRTPDSTVELGERVLQDRSGTFVPPYRRSAVLLAQQARLFPHMTVWDNIAYAPAAARKSKPAVVAMVEHWMDRTGVAALADRRPGQISGGQAQRVAIARALAADPEVLLLDEPFAALDISVAQTIRVMLRELLAQRSGITVLVTHDLTDAVSLADQLQVLDHGRIVDGGPTREVVARPGHRFTASLSGLNLLIGAHDSDGEPAGIAVVDVAGGVRVAGSADETIASGHPAAAAFSPRAVAVYLQAPGGSPRNTFAGTVTDLIPVRDHVLVRVRCGQSTIDAEVTWPAVADLGLVPGVSVFLVLKASDVRVYGAPASSS